MVAAFMKLLALCDNKILWVEYKTLELQKLAWS